MVELSENKYDTQRTKFYEYFCKLYDKQTVDNFINDMDGEPVVANGRRIIHG